MVSIVIYNVSVSKNNEIRGKTPKKCAKTVNSGIFQAFSVGISHVLGIANSVLCATNRKKLMMKSRENVKKPVFPAYFWHFQPENFFFENRAPLHFKQCHFASLCKKSKN